MKTYSAIDYRYGDLVVLAVDYYTGIKKGEIGIIGNTYSHIANITFANTSGAFPYEQFVPLEALCK